MTEQLLVAAEAAGRVLVACLLLGAGLPALFSVGLSQLAAARGVDGETRLPPALHRVFAYLMFGVVVLAILLGLSFILAHGLGFTITFNGLLPVITHA